MPGPKPLAPKEYAASKAGQYNFTLVRVLAPRVFRVRCNACASIREVASKHGHFGPQCECTYRRKFLRTKRTPKTHTAEFAGWGKADYVCTSVGQTNTYKHLTCGTSFSMSKDCFKLSKVPCACCRPKANIESEAWARRLRKFHKGRLELVGAYTDCRIPVRVRFSGCRHVSQERPDHLMRADVGGNYKCPYCHSNRSWHTFKLKGKRFRTKSLVEQRFVKFLVNELGIGVDEIEYEPTGYRVSYTNPATGKLSMYTPDFKVRNSMVEIKNLGSLGLTKGYRGVPGSEVLLVNRAKVEAAASQFTDYRVFVEVRPGRFKPAREFWTSLQQRKLLSARNMTSRSNVLPAGSG